MPSFTADLAFLEAGINELQDYLLSNEIYWPLGLPAPPGERPYPRLTMGWLLLTRQRILGWQERLAPPAAAHTVPRLLHALDAQRARWPVAWQKKAGAEFSSRLKLWANFLNEYKTDPPAHAARYPYEVNRRAMLHLLQQETQAISPEETDLLAAMDGYLRAILRPGEFVWEPQIAPAFPPEIYWYLYGNLPA